MINNYKDFINEKISDKLSGFNEEELRIQFINGKIDIEKYLYNCDKYNFKIDTELFKKLLFDEKINKDFIAELKMKKLSDGTWQVIEFANLKEYINTVQAAKNNK